MNTQRATYFTQLRLLGFNETEIAELKAMNPSDQWLSVYVEVHTVINRDINSDMEKTAWNPLKRQMAMRSRHDDDV